MILIINQNEILNREDALSSLTSLNTGLSVRFFTDVLFFVFFKGSGFKYLKETKKKKKKFNKQQVDDISPV